MYLVARVQSPNFEGSMGTKTMLRYKLMRSNFVWVTGEQDNLLQGDYGIGTSLEVPVNILVICGR